MAVDIPRLVIAGLSGDSGKTLVSLSLLAVLRRKALSLSVFKKGPDYIDAAWLARISGTGCHNLDTYMVDADKVCQSFVRYARDTDLAVVEGNRGLYDGKDPEGTHSTANLAKLLKAPVLLVVDCSKSTRTMAAVVKGCIDFDPDLQVAGVLLNRVAGERHRRVVQQAIEKHCRVPVLAGIPKLEDRTELLPARHLGLVPPTESGQRQNLEPRLAEIGREYLDIDRIISVARTAGSLRVALLDQSASHRNTVKIGYFSDQVFTFYYPENLEALKAAGAELIAVSSLEDQKLPEIDGLYIGGGFPETFVERLVENGSLLASVREAARDDMPIYAECGGLIYLCRSLQWCERRYLLAGVFPLDLAMNPKPVGHGYSLLRAEQPNPFFEVGCQIKGHEFHYSGPTGGLEAPGKGDSGCLRIESGVGLGNGRDGLLYKSTMACYTHIHADGVPDWADNFVVVSHRYRRRKASSGGGNSVARSASFC